MTREEADNHQRIFRSVLQAALGVSFTPGTLIRMMDKKSVFYGRLGTVEGPVVGRSALAEREYRRVRFGGPPDLGTLHVHIDNLREVDLVEQVGELDGSA